MKNNFKAIFRALREIARQISVRPHFSTTRQSYNDYWRSKRPNNLGYANEFQIERANWIAHRISDNETVIDLGCGDGATLLALRRIRVIDAHGVDIAEGPLEYVLECGIGISRIDLNSQTALRALSKRDHVLLLEVLEHIPESEELLSTALGIANKSVFFSVPNSGYISYRLRLLFGRFPVQWRLYPGEHLRYWTLADLKWWLEELDLTSRSEIGTYLGIPGLARFFPSLFAAGLIVRVACDCKKTSV